MYSNKFVAAVKCGGQVLREFGETIYVPFGSEYSLFFKNLNNVKVGVRVWIDGKDVLGGEELVVGANETLDLERSIREGNLDKGNRFKFIERTAGIEKHRGVKAEDGLVRIEYRWERPKPSGSGILRSRGMLGGSGDWGGALYSKGMSSSLDSMLVGSVGPMGAAGPKGPPGDSGPMLMATAMNANSRTYDPTAMKEDYFFACSASATGTKIESLAVNSVVNEVGITVEGSVSEQKFAQVEVEFYEETEIMVFTLLGTTETSEVKAPVTVASKPECKTCGRRNKAGSKFCSECGTSLVIV